MKERIFLKLIIVGFLLMLPFTFGCARNLYKNKAHVQFKWQLHTENTTATGWIRAHGWVINKGTKRADWVTVTILTIDPESDIVIEKTTVDVQGTGPNKRSLEPGAVARFDVRLNSKKGNHYKYRREVNWVEAAK